MEGDLCIHARSLQGAPSHRPSENTPAMFSPGHTCRPRYYAKLVYARSLHSAPSENIAGETHLASQNNYGKLEQVLYGQLARLSFRAARVCGSETSIVVEL